jgi:formate dehydrogenase subunit gamma
MNALLWLLLSATGIALVDHPELAVFGEAYPAFVRSLVGGGATLLRLHITLGCLWAASFIIYAVVNGKGAAFFLRSVFTPQQGDMTWLARKSIQMTFGVSAAKRLGMRLDLPPQGYYNAGQRALAALIVLGCCAVAASGAVMALAPSVSAAEHPVFVACVPWALLVHHFSVGFIIAGLFIHIYMAAIAAEERPAFLSMLIGTVPAEYARNAHPLWIVAPGAGSQHTTAEGEAS